MFCRCGQPIPWRNTYCEACKSSRPIERICVDCSEPAASAPHTGRPPKRCAACQVIAKHKRKIADVPCVDCGGPVMSSPVGQGRKHDRCLACKESRVCSLADCGRSPVVGRGYCKTHYERSVKGMDLLVPIHRRTGRVFNAGGYVLVKQSKGTRYALEHRVVMEKILGRYLWPDENIHHINGQRDDNRPENLELWSTSQPAGQRVPDKVEWAKELLRRYEPDSLIESHHKENAA